MDDWGEVKSSTYNRAGSDSGGGYDAGWGDGQANGSDAGWGNGAGGGWKSREANEPGNSWGGEQVNQADDGWSGGGQVNQADDGWSGGGQVNQADGWGGREQDNETGGGWGQDNSSWNNGGSGAKNRTFDSITFTARGASREKRGGLGRNLGDRGFGNEDKESSSSGFRRGGFGGRNRGGWRAGSGRGQQDSNGDDGDGDRSGWSGHSGGFHSSSDEPRQRSRFRNTEEQNDEGEQPGNFGRRDGFGSRGRGRGRGAGGDRSRRSEDEDDKGDGDGGDSRPREKYIPPSPPKDEQSIFSTINAGINFDRYDEIPVEVTGREAPTNVTTFEECGFFPTTMENIRRCRYIRPTPVQKYSIPIIIGGRDLMACAQTGSGKTAAFLLPAITRLIKENVDGASRGDQQSPEVLIVAPTRELTLQIYNEARKFTHDSIYKPVVAYGGTSVGHQLRQLEGGCNILVGTPGRLLDFLKRGKVLLDQLKVFILDEADRMLDMGFEPEVRKMVDNFHMPGKGERQTLMFSATFPEQIQQLAADFLNDYIFLTVGRVGGATTDISQKVVEVGEYEKRDRLSEILENMGTDRTLVFVETKRNADFLATYLSQTGFPTTSIHGDRFQREREEALRDFRSGRAPVLVATSVAARGLDIPEVKHVINYDLPQNIEEYVHRIGRTGRIGNKGMATAFFQRGKDSALARSLVKVLADAEQDVPDFLEDSAQEAIGSHYGPAGGQFAAKDIRTGSRRFEGRTNDDSGWGDDRGGFQEGFGSSTGGFTGMSAAVDDEDWG